MPFDYITMVKTTVLGKVLNVKATTAVVSATDNSGSYGKNKHINS